MVCCHDLYWMKQCIVRQQFLKQGTSNKLTYRMHPKYKAHDFKGMKFEKVVAASVLLAVAALVGYCCGHVTWIFNVLWQFPSQSEGASEILPPSPLLPHPAAASYLPAEKGKEGKGKDFWCSLSDSQEEVPKRQVMGSHFCSYCCFAHSWSFCFSVKMRAYLWNHDPTGCLFHIKNRSLIECDGGE